jgi:hypothetical protein
LALELLGLPNVIMVKERDVLPGCLLDAEVARAGLHGVGLAERPKSAPAIKLPQNERCTVTRAAIYNDHFRR